MMTEYIILLVGTVYLIAMAIGGAVMTLIWINIMLTDIKSRRAKEK